MNRFGTLGKGVVATVAACAVIAASIAIGGVVFASGGGSSSTGQGGGAASPVTVRRAGPLAGAVHADMTWTLRDGSTVRWTADAGTIDAVGNGSITIRRRDGRSVTAMVQATTCIRNDRQPAGLNDLKAGEHAVVIQTGGGALAIRARDGLAAPASAAAGTAPSDSTTNREGCHLLRGVVHGEITVLYVDGSTRHWTYDRGLITSVGGGKIMFVRADRQSVALAVDAATIVREQGHPASIDDLKVGERAMFFSRDGRALLIRCVSESSGSPA